MAETKEFFNPIKDTRANISNVEIYPLYPGQILFETDQGLNNRFYIDIDNGTTVRRVRFAGDPAELKILRFDENDNPVYNYYHYIAATEGNLETNDDYGLEENNTSLMPQDSNHVQPILLEYEQDNPERINSSSASAITGKDVFYYVEDILFYNVEDFKQQIRELVQSLENEIDYELLSLSELQSFYEDFYNLYEDDIVEIINTYQDFLLKSDFEDFIGNYVKDEEEYIMNEADAVTLQQEEGEPHQQIKFGVDSDGNYGYIKPGADTVTPFNNSSLLLSFEELDNSIIFNYLNENNLTFLSDTSDVNKSGGVLHFLPKAADIGWTCFKFLNFENNGSSSISGCRLDILDSTNIWGQDSLIAIDSLNNDNKYGTIYLKGTNNNNNNIDFYLSSQGTTPTNIVRSIIANKVTTYDYDFVSNFSESDWVFQKNEVQAYKGQNRTLTAISESCFSYSISKNNNKIIITFTFTPDDRYRIPYYSTGYNTSVSPRIRATLKKGTETLQLDKYYWWWNLDNSLLSQNINYNLSIGTFLMEEKISNRKGSVSSTADYQKIVSYNDNSTLYLKETLEETALSNIINKFIRLAVDWDPFPLYPTSPSTIYGTCYDTQGVGAVSQTVVFDILQLNAGRSKDSATNVIPAPWST